MPAEPTQTPPNPPNTQTTTRTKQYQVHLVCCHTIRDCISWQTLQPVLGKYIECVTTPFVMTALPESHVPTSRTPQHVRDMVRASECVKTRARPRVVPTAALLIANPQ